MKANEAPEKIYLNPLLMEDGESVVRRCTFERQRDSQIEYTRTDAFIEKACEWLKEECDLSNYEAFNPDDRTYYIDHDKMIDDFRKYMEE